MCSNHISFSKIWIFCELGQFNVLWIGSIQMSKASICFIPTSLRELIQFHPFVFENRIKLIKKYNNTCRSLFTWPWPQLSFSLRYQSSSTFCACQGEAGSMVVLCDKAASFYSLDFCPLGAPTKLQSKYVSLVVQNTI